MGRRRKEEEASAPTTRTRPRGGLAAVARQHQANKSQEADAGALGEINGFSVSAVMRALGAAGCSNARVTAIMRAKGFRPSAITVAKQSGAGRNKRGGEPAPLSKAQLKDLLALAPEAEAVMAD